MPEKYDHLIGEYPDHPGEGKGLTAKKRQQDQTENTKSLFAAE
jgi:hypothetical protein